MKKYKNIPKNILQDRLILLHGLVIILIFLNSCFRYFDHDEFEAVHTAWKILHGERIYVDFFQHHHPLSYYILAPLIGLFGESVSTLIVFRIFMFLQVLCLLYITYRIATELFSEKRVAVVSILFLSTSTFFFSKAIEIRPDVPQTIFALLAVHYFLRDYEHYCASLNLGAVYLGVSFLFLQKTIFLIFIIAILQVWRLVQGHYSIKRIILYWGTFTLTVLPYGIYILYNGTISEYIRCNWIVNMHFKDFFLPFDGLMETFRDNTILWTFFIVGIYISRQHLLRELSVLAILMLVSLFCIKTPYEQYYLSILPIVSILSSYGLLHTLTRQKVLMVVIVVATLLPMGYLITDLIGNGNSSQLSKISYVLRNTTQSAYVYDGNIEFNLFRKDIDYFWFSVSKNKGALATYISLYPYDYNVYRSINRYKPEVVSTYCIDPENLTITKSYYRSKKYHDLFLRRDRRN